MSRSFIAATQRCSTALIVTTCTITLCPAAFTSIACGDIVFNFDRLTVSSTEPHTLVPDAGNVLTGNLTGVTIDVNLNAASSPSAQARWLTLYVQRPIVGFHVQVGGWANQGAQQFYEWENGASSDIGTLLSGRVDFSPAVIASQIASGGFNGISLGMPLAGGQPISVTFTGTLTLHGVSYIPAPSAAPLLALAGLTPRGRRRKQSASIPAPLGDPHRVTHAHGDTP